MGRHFARAHLVKAIVLFLTILKKIQFMLIFLNSLFEALPGESQKDIHPKKTDHTPPLPKETDPNARPARSSYTELSMSGRLGVLFLVFMSIFFWILTPALCQQRETRHVPLYNELSMPWSPWRGVYFLYPPFTSSQKKSSFTR